jgi:hypothetical protein
MGVHVCYVRTKNHPCSLFLICAISPASHLVITASVCSHLTLAFHPSVVRTLMDSACLQPVCSLTAMAHNSRTCNYILFVHIAVDKRCY